MNDVLDYSKLEINEFKAQLKSFKVKSLIEETIGLFKSSIKDKNLTLDIDFQTSKLPETIY